MPGEDANHHFRGHVWLTGLEKIVDIYEYFMQNTTSAIAHIDNLSHTSSHTLSDQNSQVLRGTSIDDVRNLKQEDILWLAAQV